MTNMHRFNTPCHIFISLFVSIYSQKRIHTLKLLDVPPSIIRSFMFTALTPSMHTTIQEMRFGGILHLAAKSLNN
jgi:hypothetical protein